jgi:Rieske 2Fe-2S family protein
MHDPAPLDPAGVAAALAPFGHSRMLPRAAYTAPDVFEWEAEHIFERGWVCAGRASAVARPGDQTAVRAGRGGALVVRDDAGALHAFANACRHRGHELAPCGATLHRDVIQCPYHAWTYELDGTLRIAPRAAGAPNFVADELGLVALGVAEWGGWVFVNVTAARTFADHIGALAELVAPWALQDLIPAATLTYELAANWKLVHENYHECYHCPLIHPELCRVSPSDSGSNFRDGVGAWVGGDMELADGAETMSLDGRSHGVVLRGLDAKQRRQVVYVNLFPNLLLSLHPDYVMTHRVEPVTPGTSRIECQWLFPPEAVERSSFDPSYAVDFWDLTNRQDWAAVESVQRGLESPRFVPGVLGGSEDAVYQFVTMVASGYLGRELVRGTVGGSG